jgi:predicted nucleic acid-binding protein
MPDTYVVDASVVAKWFIKGPTEIDVDVAEDLLLAFLANDVDLRGPRILPFEVCGLLAKACRTPTGLTKESASAFARNFFSLPIPIHEDSEDELVEAIEMAVEHRKNHYDMTYVRLAGEIGARWCTADEKVLRSVPAAVSGLVVELAALRGAI